MKLAGLNRPGHFAARGASRPLPGLVFRGFNELPLMAGLSEAWLDHQN